MKNHTDDDLFDLEMRARAGVNPLKPEEQIDLIQDLRRTTQQLDDIMDEDAYCPRCRCITCEDARL